jgi:putative transposase
MPHTASNLLVHFVFSTKERAPLIFAEFLDDLHAYLGGIVREIGGKALIVNGTSDHVHILVRIPTTRSCAEIVRLLKANSSKWIHSKWPQQRTFSWQSGYGAFSVSESAVESVRAYVASQQEHHKKISFQDEFRAFLRKNNIVVDEKYLWD